MKRARLILLVLIVAGFYEGHTQIKTSTSKKVVSRPQYENTLPTYTKGGIGGFYRYLSNEVMPLMNKEDFKNSGYPPTQLN
ncbi:hypothetical protein ASU31_12260 [Pedobacter ginsenosidimutans]|uniref:Uncharacterized protein n=1 Tax=Pedobacter ginsenosidimutans TaxID=687842 RepID=A0A0T5VQ26_9SPHI|nr:hypothetical protein [Pedobacter ginsenosidimutans]KRT15753.1 hypothetical protein ASU31_12260 [Pedobacter ginsenosidimutans]